MGTGSNLDQQFNQMFLISRQQNSKICDMGSLSNGTWRWDLKWRRNLFDHEHAEAVTFMELISNVQIQPHVKDSLRWSADPSGIYSSKSAYRLLISVNRDIPQPNIYNLFWRLNIPPRAAVFAWRILKNRLPTRYNLLKRNVSVPDQTCPLCRSHQEEAGHLFFHCKVTTVLWWESMSWIKMAGPLAASPADHFIQFCDGFGTAINQTRRRCWWIALTSTIWQHRNSLVFQGKSFDPPKVMEDSLFLLWSWLKTRDRHFNDSFNYWSSNIVRYFG